MKRLFIVLSLASAMSTNIYSAAAADDGGDDKWELGANQVNLGGGNVIPLEGEEIQGDLDTLLVSLPTFGVGARHTIGLRSIDPTVCFDWRFGS